MGDEPDIKTNYPEISNYKKFEMKDIFGRCTPIEGVISLWGEPDEKKYHWWRYHIPAVGAVSVGSLIGGDVEGVLIGIGIVFIMNPIPAQTYTWHRGHYTINAEIDSSFLCGYMKRLLHWEWVQVKATETSK